MDWVDKISQFWPHVAVGFHLAAALLASAHALLNKRDTRAATLWIGVIWLMPGFGPILYLVLGVNRIRRRAKKVRPILPMPSPIPGQLKPGLMNQNRRLNGLAGRLAGHARRRQAPKLLVHQGH